MTWFSEHTDLVLRLAGIHAVLAGVPLLLGALLALPLGWLAHSRRWAYPAVVTTTGLLYTIPSLALFVLMPIVLGTRILDPVNVVVALTVYTLALLVRTVAEGLGSVPPEVRDAARAMGYGPLRRLLTVDLPVAVPVLVAGLRVAAVSNVSIVSVAAVIGVEQLGTLLTDGYARYLTAELVTGIVATLLLALVFDGVILLLGRLATPWTRDRGASRAEPAVASSEADASPARAAARAGAA